MNSFVRKPKDGYGYVYKYTSPSGKSYIGQTTHSLKDRARNHGIGYESCSVFYRAILKYGFENFSYEILGEFLQEELDEKEKFFIKKFNTVSPNGYNVQKGGKQEYFKRETSNHKIYQYDLNGNFIKAYNSVIEAAKDNDCLYQTISAVLQRKRPQHNNCIYRYDWEESPVPYKKQNNNGRKTAQYTLEGELIAIYPSANQAARAIGKNSNAGRNIRSVCEGKRNTAFGFKWKFLD